MPSTLSKQHKISTNGRVVVAAGIAKERTRTDGYIGDADGVANERLKPMAVL